MPRLEIGTRVRINEDLETGYFGNGELYCACDMINYRGQEAVVTETNCNDNEEWFYLDVTNREWMWCPEMVTVIEGEISIPETHVFNIGDIVKVIVGSYEGQIGFIKKKLPSGRFELNISLWTNFKPSELIKANEEEILNQHIESLIPIPEYTQITDDSQEFRAGMRVKLPTRRRYTNITDASQINKALNNNRDYLTIKKVSTSNEIYVYDNEESIVNRFIPADLEALDTKFVQGTLESGHRLKDKNGRSHTYEEYSETDIRQTLISNNDDYIEYIDSTGWYIRKWHRLVVKPRGTVEYTEYMAMTDEDHAEFKSNMDARKAYLNAMFSNIEINERNQKITEQINQYRDAKRRATEFLTAHAREIEEERRREENKAKLRELNALGIWKHHDKSWI